MRFKQSLFMAALTVVLLGVGSHQARAQQLTLPANWQQLSPTDFASLVRPYLDQNTFRLLNFADQTSLASQGATFFSQVDIANTTLSYQTIETLGEVCRFNLDEWVAAKAKRAITARRDDWGGKPYAENLAKVILMSQLKMPDAVCVNEARGWVLAGGTQAQLPQTDLVYDVTRQQFSAVNAINGSFSVQWAGQINVQQSGDYTFSISPIDANMGYSRHPIKVSMSVLLASQAIITATPPTAPDPLAASYTYKAGPQTKSNWVTQSNPVTLTAGTPVNFSATFSVDAADSLPSGLLHAVLFWQGPGITTTLVPASAFSQANGTPGLQASYSWTANGQPQALSRPEPMIDASWTSVPILLAQDPTTANQSADAMWQAMTASGFIANYPGPAPAATLHPFLREPDDASTGLSTARRDAFLDLLLQNPSVLSAMNANQAVSFFEDFRVGTPEKALNVFGAWAARKADWSSELSTYLFFDAATRLPLANMATFTTQQLPDQSTRLQQEFLQLPDGRCSLPVAYTLTYSYLGRSKLSDWIAFLDAKLADPSLTGDTRVNWLLARAQAQEFTRRAILHYPFKIWYPFSWPLDGMSYLYQALAAAQSPWVKVRVAKEIVVRYTSSGQYQSAKDLLAQVNSSLPAAQQAVVASWQQQIDGFVAGQGAAVQAQQAEATTLYLTTLRRRRDRAAAQGDSASVSRYDAIINAASPQQ